MSRVILSTKLTVINARQAKAMDGSDTENLPVDPQQKVVAGRFQIQRLLGEGGFGATYAAYDRETGTEVAVKNLRIDRAEDWKAIELFEREARILESLDHPRIPDYVDYVVDEDSGNSYLAQELAAGRSIEAILDDGRRFDEEETVAIAMQVLDVLIYLDTLRPRVVHRDIKPGNLLLDDDSVYLVDFGAVREVARQLGNGSTVAGTFGYMAPEQLQGIAVPASDIYGLGMTIIHMLTGRSPDSLPQVRMRPDYRGMAVISDRFCELIDSMTEVVLEDRISSPEECLQKFKNLTRPNTPAPIVPPQGAAPPRRKQPRKQTTQEEPTAQDRHQRKQKKQQRRQLARQKKREQAKEQLAIWRDESVRHRGLRIEATGDDSWEVTIRTPISRIISRRGRANFVSLTTGTTFGLAAGLAMVLHPLFAELDLAITLNLAVWGLVVLGFALWGVITILSWFRNVRSGQLSIHGNTFTLNYSGQLVPGMSASLQTLKFAPDDYDEPYVEGVGGHNLTPSHRFEPFSLAHDGSLVTFSHLTVDEVEKLKTFLVAVGAKVQN